MSISQQPTAPHGSAKDTFPYEADLIYDVGMHNGDDTAFYLAQGFRVLAIEADSDLVAKCQSRFARQIEASQLTIVNTGIWRKNGSATFWICDDNKSWNSFDRSIASRDGCGHHAIEIETRVFGDILRRYGIPFYLKIDIEGHDHLCLEALHDVPLPPFVSAEDRGVDPGERCPAILSLMHQVGYRQFKLVSQFGVEPLLRTTRERLTERVIDSAAMGRLRMPLVCKIAEYFTYENRLARRNGGYAFPPGSSGPWGERIPGRWLGVEEACRRYETERTKHFSDTRVADYSFWCDWHAKR